MLIAELERDPDNKLYHEGLLAIDKLSDKQLAPLGAGGGSAMRHFSSKVSNEAAKLEETYGHIEEIDAVLKALQQKTDALKK